MAIIYSNSASYSKDYPSYRLLDGSYAVKFNTLDGLLKSELAPFGSGTIWEAEIYRYREASLDATDHHVTTTGGVKLYVIPVYGTNLPIYPLRAFGAAEDGVNNDTMPWKTALQTIQNSGGGGLLLNGMSMIMDTVYITEWEHDLTLLGNSREKDGVHIAASDKGIIRGQAKSPFNLRVENVHLKGAWALDPKESGEECWLLDLIDIASLTTVNSKFSSSQKGLIKARATEFSESWYCVFEESTRDGWNMTGSRNTKFIGNTVRHVRDDAVALHVPKNSDDPTIGQHIVSQNYFQDCSGIAALGARNLIVTNNVGNLMRSRFCVVGVSSYWGEGMLSPFNILVQNNVVQDLIDANFFESGEAIQKFYVHMYPITPTETDTAGIPGEAAVGGGIVPLYGSFNGVGEGASFAPGMGISISGNKFMRTRASDVNYSTYGYGKFITPNGYSDGAPTREHMSPECRLRSGIRDFEFNDNLVQGAKFGIYFDFDNSSFFRNGVVRNNTFKDTWGHCFYTNAESSQTNILQVRFESNVIDGDPFYVTAGRGVDGSFANSYDLVAFYLRYVQGFSGEKNHVFNCSSIQNVVGSRWIWSGLNYQYGQCETGLFSNQNRGIGDPVSCFDDYGWMLIDYDADTTSPTFGQILDTNHHAGAMPTEGYFNTGTFVRNNTAERYTPDENGNLMLGWRRVTTSNEHVADVDWVAVYQRSTSAPA